MRNQPPASWENDLEPRGLRAWHSMPTLLLLVVGVVLGVLKGLIRSFWDLAKSLGLHAAHRFGNPKEAKNEGNHVIGRCTNILAHANPFVGPGILGACWCLTSCCGSYVVSSGFGFQSQPSHMPRMPESLRPLHAEHSRYASKSHTQPLIPSRSQRSNIAAPFKDFQGLCR